MSQDSFKNYKFLIDIIQFFTKIRSIYRIYKTLTNIPKFGDVKNFSDPRENEPNFIIRNKIIKEENSPRSHNNKIIRVKNAPPSQYLSLAHIQYENNKMRVGILANLPDFIYSQNISKLSAMTAAIYTLFSPLGIVSGAIGASIMLTSIAYSIYHDVKTYQSLGDLKKERAILEEIKQVKKELTQTLRQHSHVKEVLKGHLFDYSKNLNRYETSFSSIAAKLALFKAPSNLWQISIAITSLSPISITFATLSILSGYAGELGKKAGFNKKLNELKNLNQGLKEELGLSDFIPSKSIEISKEILSGLRTQLTAVNKFVEDSEIQKTMHRPILKTYFHNQNNLKKAQDSEKTSFPNKSKNTHHNRKPAHSSRTSIHKVERVPNNVIKTIDELRKKFLQKYNMQSLIDSKIDIDMHSTTHSEALWSILIKGFSFTEYANIWVPFRNDYYYIASSETFLQNRVETIIDMSHKRKSFGADEPFAAITHLPHRKEKYIDKPITKKSSSIDVSYL